MPSDEYDRVIPRPSTSTPSRVLCDRCGRSAGNHYEGDGECLDLCDTCMGDLADWLRGGNDGDDGPDLADIDYGPVRKPLDDGDPCPECGYAFDADEWDERNPPSGPTVGENWYYTCPDCGQETCQIGI